jgi:hypothetical protein
MAGLGGLTALIEWIAGGWRWLGAAVIALLMWGVIELI